VAETNEERHQETYTAAEQALRGRDPQEVARRLGALWVPEGAGGPRLELEALGTTVRLFWPGLQFDTDHPLLGTFPWRLIALHYLAAPAPQEPATDWISYRDLPDGLFYANTITREVEEPLARLYGAAPEGFVAAGAALGAEDAGLADASLLVRPLPYVPLVFALWREDEEFPAKVKVLYERRGAANLPLQDLRILADLLGATLKAGAARGGSDRG